MPEDTLNWNEYFAYIIGMSQHDMMDSIRDGYVEPARTSIGYDMPPESTDVILQNFSIFMHTQFTEFPIRQELSLEQLALATSQLRKHHEKCYPPTDPYTKGIWAYYGPRYDAVEEAHQRRDLTEIRTKISELLDARIHD
jgi:hypothetical protein